MPRFKILTSLNTDEDDEKEKTPSQRAGDVEEEKQEKQQEYKVLKGLNDYKPRQEQPKVEEPEEQEDERLFTKIKRKISEFFGGDEEKEEEPEEELPEFSSVESGVLDELVFSDEEDGQAIRVVDDAITFQNADVQDLFVREIEIDKQDSRVYDTAIGEAGGAFVAGVGDVTAGTGQALRWLGADGMAQKLIDKGGEWQSFQPELDPELEEFDFKDMTNPRFYTQQVARGVPFTLATIPMFLAGAYVTTAGVAYVGVSGTSALILQTIGAAALPTAFEASVEAGNAYDRSLNEGKSAKEANDAANQIFKGNVNLLSVSNALQFLPFLRNTKADDAIINRIISANTGWVKKTATGIGIAGFEVGQEGTEEVLQSKISADVLGDDFSFTSSDTQRDFVLGGVQGLFFTAGGTVIDASTGRNVTKEFVDIGIADAQNTVREIEDSVIIKADADTRVQEEGRSAVLTDIAKNQPEIVREETIRIVGEKIAQEETQQPQKPEPKRREIIKADKSKYEGVNAAQAVIRPDNTVALDVDMDKSAQGKGQGTAIVRELEEKAIEKGVTRAVLPAKEEAVGFWVNMGYDPVGEIKNGIQPMTKQLSEENLPVVRSVATKTETNNEVLKFMINQERENAYQKFLTEGNEDTFEGFVKQFNESVFNTATGEIVETGGNVEITKPLRQKPEKVEATKPSEPTREAKKKKTKPSTPKVVKIPESQLPVGGGKEKVSRLEARYRNALNATPQEIEALGLPTYRQLTEKDNIAKAAEYVVNNTEEAFKVVAGQIEPPKGVLRNAVTVALHQLGKEDSNLAVRIATLPATRAGQEIAILRNIQPDDPVKLMEDVVDVRIEAYERKTGERVTEKVKKESGKIKIETPKKADWDSFLSEIAC